MSKKSTFESQRGRVGLLFTLPWLIGALIFFVFPVIQSFLYSITKMDPLKMISLDFVGFTTYKDLFVSDTKFMTTLFSNIGSMVINVLLCIVFSLFVSVILNQKFRGRMLARAVFFLPVIVASGVVISIIRGDLFAQTSLQGAVRGSQFQVEVLQNILYSFNMDDSTITMIMSIINNLFEVVWRCGIQILIFMAGLQAIPPQVKEAASIEGATSWEYFWKITLPMITPILQINIIYSIVDSFTDYSNEMIKRIYSLTSELNFSKSSAISWLYFGIIFIIIGVVFFIMNRKTFYYVD